jgi:hypothetical protein
MVYLGANVLDQLRAAVFRSDVALDPASAVSAQSPTNTTRHFRQKGLTYATTSPPSVALAPFDENPSAMAEGHVSGIRISSCAALSTGAGVGAAAERARESMEDEDHSAYPCPNRNLRL